MQFGSETYDGLGCMCDASRTPGSTLIDEIISECRRACQLPFFADRFWKPSFAIRTGDGFSVVSAHEGALSRPASFSHVGTSRAFVEAKQRRGFTVALARL